MGLKPGYLLLIIVTLLMAGCRAQTGVIPTAAVIQPSPLPLVTASPSPSAQPISATTSIDVSSEQQNLQELLSLPCLKTTTQTPPDTISWNLLVRHSMTPYIYDVEKTQKNRIVLPFENGSQNYQISPDGKWLAYQDTENKVTYIEPVSDLSVDSSNARIVWNESPHFLEHWLSNGMLLVTRKPTEKAFFTTIILNPFSGESHEFVLEHFPNFKWFKSSSITPYLFGNSNLLPDPSLKRMIYPEVRDNNAYITLWDMEENRVLNRLNGFYEDGDNSPLWAANGQDFLILNPGPSQGLEWYQVTRDGAVKQLTNFGDILSNTPYFSKASRSWDGNYLAFQIQYTAKGKTITRYLVLDLHSKTLDGFCIDSVAMQNGEEMPPVWSPDSRFLAISNTMVNSYGDLILVDIITKNVYPLLEDVHALGWLEKP